MANKEFKDYPSGGATPANDEIILFQPNPADPDAGDREYVKREWSVVKAAVNSDRQGAATVVQVTANTALSLLTSTSDKALYLYENQTETDWTLTPASGLTLNGSSTPIIVRANSSVMLYYRYTSVSVGDYITVGEGQVTNSEKSTWNSKLDAEQVMDLLGSQLVAGSNVSITYDDATGTITIAATGGGGGGSGDVVGPVSSTDNNIVLFNGATGKLIKDSGVQLSTIQNQLTSTSDTGTAIQFDIPRTYGITTAETGNITLNATNAVSGQTVLIRHNSGTAPTFGSEFKRIGGFYVTGVINYIYCQYVSSTEVLYTVNQQL